MLTPAGQCFVCRKRVDSSEGVTMHAFGKPLFDVHAEPCANTVRGVMRFVGGAAGVGTRKLMQKRTPQLLRFTDGAVRALKGGDS